MTGQKCSIPGTYNFRSRILLLDISARAGFGWGWCRSHHGSYKLILQVIRVAREMRCEDRS